MASTAHRVCVAVGVFITSVVMVACDRESTAPSERQPPAAEAPAARIELDVSTALAEGMDDVLHRVVPSLGDAESIATLQSTLTTLRTTVVGRDVSEIIKAQQLVDGALVKFTQTDRDDVVIPDLAVLQFLLDQIKTAVGTLPID